jgi:hypothetical protein
LFILGVWRIAHDPAKVGDQVRLLTRIFEIEATCSVVNDRQNPTQINFKTELDNSLISAGPRAWLGGAGEKVIDKAVAGPIQELEAGVK